MARSLATLTPAEFPRRAIEVLDEFDASDDQRGRATRASLLLYAGRWDEALATLAELTTHAGSDGERQRWLDLGDEVVRAREVDASRQPPSTRQR